MFLSLLSTIMYRITTHFQSLLLLPRFQFLTWRNVFVQRKAVLFICHVQCKWRLSTSCKLHSVSCKSLLITVKSLSQMFMSRTCMSRLSLFIGNISIFWCTDTFYWFVYNNNTLLTKGILVMRALAVSNFTVIKQK